MSALALLGGKKAKSKPFPSLAAVRREGRTRSERGAGEPRLVAHARDQDTGVRTGLCQISRSSPRDRSNQRNRSPGSDHGGTWHPPATR